MITHSVKTQRSKRSTLADPLICPSCLLPGARLLTGRIHSDTDGTWHGKVTLAICSGCQRRFSWRKP